MTLHERLTMVASLSAATVVSAMLLLRKQMFLAVTAPSRGRERMRLAFLKARGVEEYVGRHRAQVMPA